MLTLGAHLSASKGFCDMYNVALSIGANTFQFLHAIRAAAKQSRLMKTI